MKDNDKIYTAFGVDGTLDDIAAYFGKRADILRQEIANGVSIEDAISKNSKVNRQDIRDAAENSGINYHTLTSRVRNGMTIQEATSTQVLDNKTVYKVFGFIGDVESMAIHFSVMPESLLSAIENGMPLKKAIMHQKTLHHVQGFVGNAQEVARHFNVDYQLMEARIKNGWTFEKAATTQPICTRKKYELTINKGEPDEQIVSWSLNKIARYFNINYSTLRQRVMDGEDVEEAATRGVKRNKVFTINGETGSVHYLSIKLGFDQLVLMEMVKNLPNGAQLNLYPVSKTQIFKVWDFKGTIREISMSFKLDYRKFQLKIMEKGPHKFEEIIREMRAEDPLAANNTNQIVFLYDKAHPGKVKKYILNGCCGTVRQLSSHFGVSTSTIRKRINEGENTKVKRRSSKKYTVFGFTGSTVEIANKFGINYNCLYRRLKKGLPIEQAVLIKEKVYKANGFSGTLSEVAEHFDFPNSVLNARVKRGANVEEALAKPLKNKPTLYTINIVDPDGDEVEVSWNLSQISKHFGIDYSSLRARIAKGMSIQEALEKPPRKNPIYEVEDFKGTVPQIAKHFGLTYPTLRQRMLRGYSIEQAVKLGRNPQRKKLFTVDGFTGTKEEIAEHFGVNYHTFCARLSKMPIEEAVRVPYKRQPIIYTIRGFSGNIKQIAKHFDLKSSYLYLLREKGKLDEDKIEKLIQKREKKQN